jgi:hypothetical protein
LFVLQLTWGKLRKTKPVSLANFAIIVNSINSASDLDFYRSKELYKYSHVSKNKRPKEIKTSRIIGTVNF